MSDTIKKAEATAKTHLHNIMQIAIFNLNDNKYYGINVSKIKSFEDFKKFKLIKNDTIESKYLDGYIQFHDNVIPVINVEKWLEVYSEKSVYYEYMVCEFNKHLIAFPISGIKNIFNVPIENLQKPDHMFEDIITYNSIIDIDGEDTICLVLDVEKLIFDTFGADYSIEDLYANFDTEKEVLIAEDSKTARTIINDFLSKTNLKYTIFNDGKEIIDYMAALEKNEVENIGIVVTDLEMPIKDGFQVIKYIKETTTLSDIPVLVNTSMSDKGVEVKIEQMGACGFIPKTEPETFLGEIRKNIR